MIKITAHRVKPEGPCGDPVIHNKSPFAALTFLTEVELAWGANIIDVSETKLVTETRTSMFIDTTIFEGTADEMKPLLQLAYFYNKACGSSEANEDLHRQLDALPNQMGGNPRHLDLAGPMHIGESRLKVAYLSALELDEEVFKKALTMRFADIVTAVKLMVDCGMTFAEVLEATAPPPPAANDDESTAGATGVVQATTNAADAA